MTRGCEAPECERDAYGNAAYCHMHLRRLRRTGFLDPAQAAYDKFVRGFLALLGPPTDTDCTEFQGLRDRDGYGLYGSYRHGPRRTHRLAYELAFGPIEDPDLQVLHACDNPPCCNPGHLSLGTNLDNVADMVARGRVRNWRTREDVDVICPNGHELTPENSYPVRTNEKHPRCKTCVQASNRRGRLARMAKGGAS